MLRHSKEQPPRCESSVRADSGCTALYVMPRPPRSRPKEGRHSGTSTSESYRYKTTACGGPEASVVRAESGPCRTVPRRLMIRTFFSKNRRKLIARQHMIPPPPLHCSFRSPLDGSPRRGGQKKKDLKLQSRAPTMWDMKPAL